MRPFAASPAIEGARANRNLYCSQLEGATPLQAGPAGVVISRFAWTDPVTGLVANQVNPAGKLGFVPPVYASWQRLYFDCGEWVLRSGQRIVVASRGDFWCRFMGGAYPGQKVYASIADGSAAAGISGLSWEADSSITADEIIYTADGGGYQLTPWVVTTQAAPGRLAIISTWAIFSPAQ
jgi:hypothetical protein